MHMSKSVGKIDVHRCPHELNQCNEVHAMIECSTWMCVDCFQTCDSDGLEILLEPEIFASNEKYRDNSNLNLGMSEENDSTSSDSSQSTESDGENINSSSHSLDSLMLR